LPIRSGNFSYGCQSSKWICFTLYLDSTEQELEELKIERIQTQLNRAFSDEDLGKLVSLEFGENKGPDGIELKYFPENESWEKVKEIRVKINERAYNHVQEKGSFGTRYNGSDKIEIVNGILPSTPDF